MSETIKNVAVICLLITVLAFAFLSFTFCILFSRRGTPPIKCARCHYVITDNEDVVCCHTGQNYHAVCYLEHIKEDDAE